MGVNYKISGVKVTKLFSIFYLIGTTILFFILSLLSNEPKTKIDSKQVPIYPVLAFFIYTYLKTIVSEYAFEALGKL